MTQKKEDILAQQQERKQERQQPEPSKEKKKKKKKNKGLKAFTDGDDEFAKYSKDLEENTNSTNRK